MYISVWIEDKSNHTKWLLSGFYGESLTSRSHIWSLLEEIQPLNLSPWMLVSNFNEIILHSEKFGGPPRSEKLMQNFRDALDRCNLTDLRHVGDYFLWSNKYEDNTFTKERPDRAFANQF